ncbi:DNA polymerase IV [Alloscardovia theropitheci]|uniref:DNA polymerase IV n=1 Tax=Alloscardovia theropitheci TaxID=2496842 RepID=A0A4R0QUL6_9BIFI|nr:DNA polymerase IV [Alloscardovia theropitheci]TCD53707.1 DNA polymerase IV [Alloscardovia theropitheci]
MSTAPRNEAVKRDWGHDASGCTILHIDMDAFYASCEIRRHPELAGKPVIIGTGTRSVVSAANYEARVFGVNSAMPVARARKLCPHGVFLPVDMDYYRAISHQVFDIFGEITDCIEHVSVDECFMDVSNALRIWKSPVDIARWIRATVYKRLGLTCSVGIATNKLIAKLASTNAKPNGMLLIPANRHADFIRMMPVRSIPGVGPSTQKRLEEYGVTTVAQLSQLREIDIIHALGSAVSGHNLYLAAQGKDERKVVVNAPEKSIGHERTLREDTRDARTVLNLLRQSCDATASTLRARGLVARTITVKLRFANLNYASKSFTMTYPTQSAAELFSHAKTLLNLILPRNDEKDLLPQFIRLAGISTSNLSAVSTTMIQDSFGDLFDDDPHTSHESDDSGTSATESKLSSTRSTLKSTRKAEKTLDDIRKRFGKDAINFGI